MNLEINSIKPGVEITNYWLQEEKCHNVLIAILPGNHVCKS